MGSSSDAPRIKSEGEIIKRLHGSHFDQPFRGLPAEVRAQIWQHFTPEAPAMLVVQDEQGIIFFPVHAPWLRGIDYDPSESSSKSASESSSESGPESSRSGSPASSCSSGPDELERSIEELDRCRSAVMQVCRDSYQVIMDTIFSSGFFDFWIEPRLAISAMQKRASRRQFELIRHVRLTPTISSTEGPECKYYGPVHRPEPWAWGYCPVEEFRRAGIHVEEISVDLLWASGPLRYLRCLLTSTLAGQLGTLNLMCYSVFGDSSPPEYRPCPGCLWTRANPKRLPTTLSSMSCHGREHIQTFARRCLMTLYEAIVRKSVSESIRTAALDTNDLQVGHQEDRQPLPRKLWNAVAMDRSILPFQTSVIGEPYGVYPGYVVVTVLDRRTAFGNLARHEAALERGRGPAPLQGQGGQGEDADRAAPKVTLTAKQVARAREGLERFYAWRERARHGDESEFRCCSLLSLHRAGGDGTQSEGSGKCPGSDACEHHRPRDPSSTIERTNKQVEWRRLIRDARAKQSDWI